MTLTPGAEAGDSGAISTTLRRVTSQTDGFPEDSLDRLELFAGDNVYVLYDLDVIDKGLKLADTIAERCKKEGVR